jgi:hypothetical protein
MSAESRKYGKSWAGMANCVMACLNGERSVFCTPKGNVAFIIDSDLTALRAENEKLKADKRELVEACEKAKFLIESPATSFMDSIRKRAMGTLEVINELIAKHREK